MVLTLEEARSLSSVITFNTTTENGRYEQVFRDYGIDMDALDIDEAAARIRASAIRRELTVSLDSWASARERMKTGEKDWQRLLAIVQKADPDPWRNRMRVAQQQRDLKALVELARLEEMAAQPVQTVGCLGDALMWSGAFKEAAAFLAKVQRRHPQDFWINLNLASCLRNMQPPQLDEAIRYFTAAIAINPGNVMAHNNLGNALRLQGRTDEAIAEYREAIRLKKDSAPAHCNLGNTLRLIGQLEEAIAQLNEAIRIEPDFAEAHGNLGLALLKKGEYPMAVAELRRSHELGSRDPRWRYPSAQWLKEAMQMAELDRRLGAIDAGTEKPASVQERLALAQLCAVKHRHRAALRFYEEAFTAQPRLLAAHRYNAACAAALAGSGKGQDAEQLEDTERSCLRRQALDWLRTDLEAWGERLDQEPAKARPVIVQQMHHWLEDRDFAGVRGPEALAQLPAAERQPWQELWTQVAALLARARAVTKPAHPPNSK